MLSDVGIPHLHISLFCSNKSKNDCAGRSVGSSRNFAEEKQVPIRCLRYLVIRLKAFSDPQLRFNGFPLPKVSLIARNVGKTGLEPVT